MKILLLSFGLLQSDFSSTKAPISFGGDSDDDYDEDGSDQDEMTQRMNNHGFTNDEVMELLSQGVKARDRRRRRDLGGGGEFLISFLC